MALFHTQNTYCLGGNHVTWWILKTMVDASWTIVQSGSGISGIYAASNIYDMTQMPKQNSLKDPNNQGVGSEPWGHAYCWAVLEDPAGNRQIAIMRDSSNTDSGDDEWYFGYSPGGRFGEGQTAGIDWDEITLPAAPDQQNLFGTPTAWATIFQTGGNASLVHVAADNAASPEGEYGVFMVEFTGGNVQSSTFFIDDLRNAPVGHPHALTLLVEDNNDIFTSNSLGGASTPVNPKTMQDFGGGGEAWINVQCGYLRFGSVVEIPGSGGVGIDGVERSFPLLVGFSGTEDWMGTSRWIYWASLARGYPTSANMRKDIYVNSCVIRDLMDGTETPLTI